jgi:hypothetical protein
MATGSTVLKVGKYWVKAFVKENNDTLTTAGSYNEPYSWQTLWGGGTQNSTPNVANWEQLFKSKANNTAVTQTAMKSIVIQANELCKNPVNFGGQSLNQYAAYDSGVLNHLAYNWYRVYRKNYGGGKVTNLTWEEINGVNFEKDVQLEVIASAVFDDGTNQVHVEKGYFKFNLFPKYPHGAAMYLPQDPFYIAIVYGGQFYNPLDPNSFPGPGYTDNELLGI